jgi:hypothetical protein
MSPPAGEPVFPGHSVSVRGSATLRAPPDMIFITLYVFGEGMLTEDAVRNADSKAGEVREALMKAFPKLGEITLARVKIGEKTSRAYRPDGLNQTPSPEVITRLRLTLTIALESELARIIDTALRAGAVLQVNTHSTFAGDLGSIVRYGVADAAKLEEKARADAITNARKQASALAGLAGKTLGQIISVEDEPRMQRYDPYRMAAWWLPLDYYSFVNEPIDIRTDLRVTFELKS